MLFRSNSLFATCAFFSGYLLRSLCFLLFVFGVLLSAGCNKKPSADQAAGPLTDYVSMRNEVVKRVKSGTLKPDASGAVQLPPELQSVSSDGRVLVANDPNAGLMILFKSMPLRPGEMMGMLYSDHAPAPTIDLRLSSLTVKVWQKMNEHWSEVSCHS